MRVLRSHHITNLVTVADSFLPRAGASPHGGRPVILHSNETVALLLFSSFVAPQRTMKGIYNWAQTYYHRRFHLPSYKSFVRKCHQALPGMLFMFDQLLVKDAQHLVNDATAIAVGDGTYNASVMRRKMWREHQAYILAPPHPKQNKKLLQQWQLLLLHKRTKTECTFDYLKEHLLLETSFPRSVQGYALHYVRVLPAYQLMWGL
ncbi:hypothetical protein IPL85_00785 [Candidatus Saccharibacteria bacterium]|nr:MAG: hypothetical protein IPL85_00785 [Candidatus Saccharibacteria bacterium]